MDAYTLGMRSIILSLLVAISSAAFAQDQYVSGHFDEDGNWHEGYHRTKPDNNRGNNYSSEGRSNPWTGKEGTIDPAERRERQSAPAFGESTWVEGYYRKDGTYVQGHYRRQ